MNQDADATEAATDDEWHTRAVPPVLGHFELGRKLGAGGMGVVFAARDQLLERQVAVKLVLADAGEPSGLARARLMREAQALGRLSHPNVVTVHEVGVAGDELFIAMELVDGTTLREWMRAPRPWQQIVELFVAVGRGLEAAHALGFVHRDFKPTNVLIDGRGVPKVSDFGLVGASGDAAVGASGAAADAASSSDVVTAPGGRVVASALAPGHSTATAPSTTAITPAPSGVAWLAGSLTRPRAVLGTPAYMAPEQAAGELVDARADQYSFCVTLREALTGVSPSRTDGAATGRPIPAALRSILARGLAADRERRYPTMTALLDELARTRRPRRWLAPVAAASTVLAIGTVGFVMVRANGPSPDEVCPAPTARVAKVWDPSRRATLQAHLRAVDPAQGAGRFTVAARAYDDFANEWGDMHVEACKATRVRGEQSDTLLDRRMRCLDARFGDFGRKVDKLAAVATSKDLDHAIGSAINLPSLDDCADTKALGAVMQPPTDPIARATSERLIKEADEIRVAMQTSNVDDLTARATKVVEEARALGDPPTLSRALDTLSRVQRFTGDVKTEVETERELAKVSAAAHDDVQAAQALSDLVYLTGRVLHRPDEALALVPAADAALARIGSPPWMVAELRGSEGSVLAFTPRHDEAIAKLEEAVRLERESVAKSDAAGRVRRTINLLSAEGELGIAKAQAGQLVEAEQLFRDIDKQNRELYGGEHPTQAINLGFLGNTLSMEGKHDEAIAAYQETIRIESSYLGDTVNLAVDLGNLGEELVTASRFADAIAPLQRAMAVNDKQPKPDPERRASLVRQLARAYDGLGRGADADKLFDDVIASMEAAKSDRGVLGDMYNARGERRHLADRCHDAFPDFDKAAALFVEAEGPSSASLVQVLGARGLCSLTLARPADAIAPLRRAVAIELAEPDVEQSVARAYLGIALTESKRDRKGGVAMVRAARAELAAHPDEVADALAAVDAWLAQQK